MSSTSLICRRSSLKGEVRIPGSKSHTIRALAIASLAPGESTIRAPLDSNDTRAAVGAYRALGAEIETGADVWTVRGTGGELRAPEDVIDVGNSGVTIRTSMGSCALLREGMAVLTGDEQIRRRPAGPLAASLNDLGAKVRSTRGSGTAPFVVEGRLRGGETSIEAVTSQYLSALLINCPYADGESVIRVPVLNEAPYVEMTLDWIRQHGIELEQEDLRRFRIPGGQRYRPVERAIPADFSSATFFLGAGALGENDIVLRGLDMRDTQGDKAVVDFVRQMGAEVEVAEDCIRVRAGELVGCEIDLNATPDALPTLAVLGCLARGTTRLVNVPQARVKETDRIAVMEAELTKLGARVEQLEDGIVVHESALTGAEVEGHGDHRVVMALAVAGCSIPGTTVVRGAEAAAVTFPQFADDMISLGADIEVRR
ncbi:MAG TPA: 3-phosphoshikimate 1-carboxyvinyltransferase [Armatimonadota bacterium]|nr:3-phosphoshikimate 1-carboxyvinyltransferase [Armatimonadota bacterium]